VQECVCYMIARITEAFNQFIAPVLVSVSVLVSDSVELAAVCPLVISAVVPVAEVDPEDCWVSPPASVVELLNEELSEEASDDEPSVNESIVVASVEDDPPKLTSSLVLLPRPPKSSLVDPPVLDDSVELSEVEPKLSSVVELWVPLEFSVLFPQEHSVVPVSAPAPVSSST